MKDGTLYIDIDRLARGRAAGYIAQGPGCSVPEQGRGVFTNFRHEHLSPAAGTWCTQISRPSPRGHCRGSADGYTESLHNR